MEGGSAAVRIATFALAPSLDSSEKAADRPRVPHATAPPRMFVPAPPTACSLNPARLVLRQALESQVDKDIFKKKGSPKKKQAKSAKKPVREDPGPMRPTTAKRREGRPSSAER